MQLAEEAPRRIQQLLTLAILTGLIILPPSLKASTTAPAPVQVPSYATWSRAVHRTPPAKVGCFVLTYPSTTWNATNCVTAPPVQELPSRPSTVGNDHDYVAESSGPLIGSSIGYFQSVNGLTSESDNLEGNNRYSLQVNSNGFTTSTSYTALNGVSKSAPAFEQFVYLNYIGCLGSFCTGCFNDGCIYIQYWLLDYYLDFGSCPSTSPPGSSSSGWSKDTSGVSCFANSGAINAPSEGATGNDLANLVLAGYANYNYNGLDEVVFCTSNPPTSGSCYDVTITDAVLNLYNNWDYSEFNVLGYGGGSQAIFNSGASITVGNGLSAQNGNSISQISCAADGSTYSVETNNLNLVSCSSFSSSGAIVFTETNPPTLSVSLVIPPSPPNGGTVTSVPVTFEAQVTTGGGPVYTGSAVQSASVLIYLDGSNICSGSSNSNGYYSCSYSPNPGLNGWYATASATGYNPATTPTDSFTYSPPNFAFTISTPPTSQSTSQSGSATFTFTVQTTQDTPQSVTLSLSNQPQGTTLSWNGNSGSTYALTPSTSGTNAQLTIQTSCSTPAQSYSSLKITGSGGGASASSNSFTLTVTSSASCQPFGFSISTPSTQTTSQGGSATFSFTVTTTQGTPQSVTLSLVNQPSGTSLSWSPSQTITPSTSGTNVQLTIQTSCSTTAQPYNNLQISGTGGTSSGSFTLTVSSSASCQPFAFSISTPSSQSTSQGGSATFTFTVTTTQGTPQSVTLSLLNQPPGTALSWSPSNTITPSTSGTQVQLTISTSCSTTVQPYSNLQISGGASASGSFSLTVTANTSCGQTEQISVSTDKTSYAQGESVQYTASGFIPGDAVISCLTTSDVAYNGLCVGQANADSNGNSVGSMFVGTNIPVGPQMFWVQDNSKNPPVTSNSVQLTITSATTASVTFITNPASAGSISWDSCSNPGYTNGQTLESNNFGVHTICANTLTNAPFAGWSCTSSISCSGLNPISTATFNGPGSITANFGFPPINFDFRLSNSGSSSNLGGVTIARGSSGTVTVTVALVNGPAQTVTLSCSQANGLPLPSGVSCSPGSGTPPFGATLTITVSSSTVPGYYSIKVVGASGSLTRITIFALHVT